MALAAPLVLAAPGSAAPAGDLPAAAAAPAGQGQGKGKGKPEPYELLQLNLCLSGLAGCFEDTEYPKVVDEAIDTIEAERPDAVTVNEACSGDIERIADETGYESKFATVLFNDAPLPCRDPGDRGVFGNAVLVDGGITSSQDQAFQAQLGSEERRVLCAVTDAGVRVCTAHLSVAGSAEQAATNDAQCAELTVLLGQDGQRRATIFGGDVNRQESCAPAGFWTLTDSAATQAPGIQHAYGSRAWLQHPESAIVPLTYTDHDGLLARALLRQGAPAQGRGA